MTRLLPICLAASLLGGWGVAWAQPVLQSGSTTAASSPTPALPRPGWEQLFRVSKIIGSDVRNRDGQKIGGIKDVVIDRNGTVSYAIVAAGGFLGLGKQLHAVPWDLLQVAPDRNYRILDIDKARLRQAPNFDPDVWPNIVDERWAEQNRRFYDGSGPRR